MVLRASAHQPRTMVERTEDATRRLEDQRRQQGRGSTALRNRNHVLVLEPGSQSPLLTPTTVDSGIGFGAKLVEVVSGDGTDYADMAMRGIDARGPIQATGDVRTVGSVVADTHLRAEGEIRAGLGIRAEGGISSGADSTFPRVYADNLSITGNSIWSFDRDGAIRWENEGALSVVNRNGTAGRGVFMTNWSSNYPSWRAWKTAVPLAERLGRPALDVVADLDLTAYRYDPDTAPDCVEDFDTEFVGPMLDEIPEVLRTRIPPTAEELADGTYDPDRQASWSRDGLLTVALAAIQEQQAVIQDQQVVISELRGRLEAVEAVTTQQHDPHGA